MKETPQYILRNCTIFVDRDSKVGNASEITIPKLTVKTESMRNAGMIKERDVVLGYEKLEMSFKMTAFDPETLKLFGLAAGVEKDFLATGALVDEDGTTHSATCYMRGFLREVDAGGWKPGDKAETDYQVSVHSMKLEIDGASIVEIDDFDVKIGGVSQNDSIRSALQL
ncbi:phage major tail tube protein [Pseudovibrio brasiliensis]|uniref:Phage major tail tube protein n=1 Tax=Pseudovibrio brasiliensis TaxID=1898042 RepID=A0ABX8AQL5_9HYPH|nr:phage major tail tube protein [Pseudovibrio brasiliensis]QUS57363.1 phage major tail tube protein [Pseudovibrio brasiliensis]